jgi:hypothetical protein
MTIVQAAERLMGVPYAWQPYDGAFDCSELVRAAAASTVDTSIQWQPALVTVPQVEILEVGEEWETSTGVFDFMPEDLVAAIESQEDPAVRTPVLKLGHTDPRFDGQPSLGRLENMSLVNNDMTLVADLVGIPLWLAQIMASAYPRRSIEGGFNYTTKTGNNWSFVLSGLALLGDAYPAINTLEDIQALFGATPPVLLPVEDVDEIAASGAFFRARRLEAMPNWLKRTNAPGTEVAAAAAVRAQVGLDDIRRSFYDSLDAGQMWWWIREIRVNPLQLIVDDDEGGLYTVDITVDGSDTVTFGEPTQVKIQYVAAGRPQTERQAGQLVAASYGTSDEAGGRQRPPGDDNTPSSPTAIVPPTSTDTGGEGMQITPEVLAQLGLPADATEDQVNQALLARLSAQPEGGETDPATPADPATQPETPATDPAGTPAPAPEAPQPEQPAETQPTTDVTIPEGMALVDAATLAELREGNVAARTLMQERNDRDRDTFIEAAVHAGKFPRSQVAHYQTLWNNEIKASGKADSTRDLITKMSAGLIPVTERGSATETDPQVEAASYPEQWKPAVAASRRGMGSKIKVVGD